MTGQLPSQVDDLPFHFRIFAPLPHSFEVRLNFAGQSKTLTSLTRNVYGVRGDVAPKLKSTINADAVTPRRSMPTFCWRHSLHALFTPGCLLLLPLASYPSSGLPGELSAVGALRLFPLKPVGLVRAVVVEAFPTLPALLWVRPNEATGCAFMEVEA